MRFFRRQRFVLIFLALLVFCSVMVIREFQKQQFRHVEIREAFVMLYIKGYKKESERLYQRLLRDTEKLSDKALLDDFQRTLLLVDPMSNQPDNLIWNYHWTVSKILDKRSEGTLMRALKLAGQEKE